MCIGEGLNTRPGVSHRSTQASTSYVHSLAFDFDRRGTYACNLVSCRLMIVRTASTASQLGSESLRKGQKGVMEAFVGGHDVFAALPLPAMEKVCAIY